METLDRNAMEELARSGQLCNGAVVVYCPPALSPSCHSDALILKPPPILCACNVRPWWAFEMLTEGLKACGGEFYDRCPGFERLERVCKFEPAIEAAKLKEQVQLDRIAKLEARVQELELKKRG
jgi:hypothetical protein